MKSKTTDCGDVFDSGKPHFFKVILQETITDKRLAIPEMFVKKHGAALSSPVSLKLPGGTTWKIDLLIEICSSSSRTSANKNIFWLCNETWHKFAQHYSLKHGHSLVFQYEGGSLFTIAIFDVLKGPEIQYPESITSSSSSTNEFVSKYPFFKVVISQLHLAKNNMWVPREFSKRYMMMKTSKVEVKVQVGEEWWKVNACRYKAGNGIYNVQMNGGFACFAKANSIEVGDVCFFELLSAKEGGDGLSFKVTIVRQGGKERK